MQQEQSHPDEKSRVDVFQFGINLCGRGGGGNKSMLDFIYIYMLDSVCVCVQDRLKITVNSVLLSLSTNKKNFV